MKASYLYKVRFFITAIVIFVVSACQKEKKDGPKIYIEADSIFLTSLENEDDFLINNVGDETLEWEIANKPRWLDISDLIGKIDPVPGSVKIEVEAKLTEDFGTYEGEIEINSNGGNYTIYVSFDYELLNPNPEDIGIYPGEGVDNMEIWDTYLDMVEEYGEPDKAEIVDTILDENGKLDFFWGYAGYEDLGIGFDFNCGKNEYIHDTSYFFLIELQDPYPRKTNRGIGVNNLINDVVSVYGVPPSTDIDIYEDDGVGIYWYMSKGISFIYDLETEKLDWILVHSANSSKSTVSKIKQWGVDIIKNRQ